MGGSESGEEESKDKVSFPAIVSGEGVERNRDQPKTSPCPWRLTWIRLLVLRPPGQFLLERARLREAAEMAERAAELESSEFDVVFSAAHMLR